MPFYNVKMGYLRHKKAKLPKHLQHSVRLGITALAAQIAKTRISYHEEPISYKGRTLVWALSDIGSFHIL